MFWFFFSYCYDTFFYIVLQIHFHSFQTTELLVVCTGKIRIEDACWCIFFGPIHWKTFVISSDADSSLQQWALWTWLCYGMSLLSLFFFPEKICYIRIELSGIANCPQTHITKFPSSSITKGRDVVAQLEVRKSLGAHWKRCSVWNMTLGLSVSLKASTIQYEYVAVQCKIISRPPNRKV